MRRARNDDDRVVALLGAINSKLDQLLRLAEAADAPCFTIQEFCQRNRISDAAYHNLRKSGRGPRLMKIGKSGRGVRISREAEADWIHDREVDTAEKAGTTKKETD